MKRFFTALSLAASAPLCLAAPPVPAPLKLTIDAAQVKGPMIPIWAWFGYDEPNYTTAPNGKKLLSDIAALSPVPVYVRAHNLMTSGRPLRRPAYGRHRQVLRDYATGKTGSPLDFVDFHAKGSPKVVNGVVRMAWAST